MTQNRLKCWTRKDKDLLMADKVANSDEKPVDAFDGCPSYEEPAEKSASQEIVEKLKRGFFYFNDHDLDGYTDSGDLGTGLYGKERERRQGQTIGSAHVTACISSLGTRTSVSCIFKAGTR